MRMPDRVHDDLEAAVRTALAERGVDVTGQDDWLTTPNVWLHGVLPTDAIVDGDTAGLARAISGLVQDDTAGALRRDFDVSMWP